MVQAWYGTFMHIKCNIKNNRNRYEKALYYGAAWHLTYQQRDNAATLKPSIGNWPRESWIWRN